MVTHLKQLTFWESFSSSSLADSMWERDCLHSLLKMSFMRGEHSDRTFRHNEIRSTSSSVIGFLGREDFPKWRIVAISSIASALKDWEGAQREWKKVIAFSTALKKCWLLTYLKRMCINQIITPLNRLLRFFCICLKEKKQQAALPWMWKHMRWLTFCFFFSWTRDI